MSLWHHYIQQKMLSALNQDNNHAGASNSEALIVVEFGKDSLAGGSLPLFSLLSLVPLAHSC